MIPTENTSHFDEYFSPINISIGKYKGVPLNYNKYLKMFVKLVHLYHQPFY